MERRARDFVRARAPAGRGGSLSAAVPLLRGRGLAVVLVGLVFLVVLLILGGPAAAGAGLSSVVPSLSSAAGSSSSSSSGVGAARAAAVAVAAAAAASSNRRWWLRMLAFVLRWAAAAALELECAAGRRWPHCRRALPAATATGTLQERVHMGSPSRRVGMSAGVPVPRRPARA
eukprot:CAMPEP_0194600398 /NCGR_PEP_ID=MMETSP0292-20121207/28325_1 /TAXON_ID=39354 /ORGANISM="Heterosigma akashiwo, Strain CCMP2393" /LENGTH=173 /DNA_ID=CAMNT_0039462031 /DNA_START=238 /DNA_END=760 /DNA_ORIENTATION=+